MAYTKFIPQVWSEAIQRALEPNFVFVNGTNRQFEGDVSKAGDTVHIIGANRPKITTTTRATLETSGIGNPTTDTGTDTTITVDTVSYFNFKVDDIDKRQGLNGMMDAYTKESAVGIADEMDKHVSKLAADATQVFTAATQVTSANIFDVIDDGIQMLYENNVKPDSEIELIVPPAVFMLMKQNNITVNTNNSGLIENGKMARYGNVTIKLSNNVCLKDKTIATRTNKATSENPYQIMIRTPKAIAFVLGMTHTEAYRPEKSFSDALKGFNLYQGAIVRPDEIVALNIY